MFNWLKNLFSKKEEVKEEYHVIIKRGYEIILPKSFYEMCKENNYSLSVIYNKSKKPTSVQVTSIVDGQRTYIGTVKKMLNIAKFKDKNVCNFSKENIVEKENKNDKK